MRLQPLAIGDVLDETFRIYRRQFRTFVVVMGIVAVPLAIISSLIQLVAGTLGESLQRNPTSITSLAGITAFLVLMIVGLLGGLARVVAAAAAVRITSNAILGLPIDVGAAYREAFSRLGSVLWASFLAGLVAIVLAITCLGIPFAIYIGLGWMLVIPLIILEGQGATAALGRSWELVRSHRWRLLITMFLMGLIAALLVGIPTGLFAFVMGIVAVVFQANPFVMTLTQIGNIVLGALGETLFGAISYITLTLLYYDLRIRKEAFDLQQRVPHTDLPPDSP